MLILLLVVGCSGIKIPGGQTRSSETPQVVGTPTTVVPTLELTPVPVTEAVNTPSGPVILRIWLPPQFDPASGNSAGLLLQSRLDQFVAIHPEVKIEVRLKAVDGPGGLLEALSTAGAAAPLVLPDVIALPRPLLEAAALKGLIHPFSDQPSPLNDPDWYDYARELGRLQNSTFGLPFAGDALVLVYQPGQVSSPPQDWTSLLRIDGPLIFPAADPQALFTLALYQSTGGPIQDELGRPALVENNLYQVLTLYQGAGRTGLMPYTLTQFDTDNQVWTAYQDDQALMVITWISRYITDGNSTSTSRAAQLPTANGVPFTLATGWMWTLASTQPERQLLGAQLAEFLSSADFLAEWSLSIGYLPTRASSTAAWSDADLKYLADQVSRSAHPIPSTDVLSSLGVPLSHAVVQVLKQQNDPLTAAQEAANYLRNP
jgi:ABC-type glycerol-3-phosphate transport system substrate-binding protein